MENSLGTSVRSLNVYDGLALLVAVTLVGVGFFIGTAGSGATGGTTSAELTVTPDGQVRPLAPGATGTFPVYVKNSTDYGVRVTSISAGSSAATVSGCPAGTLTSTAVDSPVGFIRASSLHAYEVSVTMAATADAKCKGQAFTLPLTVTFSSAAADRHFSFGSS
ncbi:MAG: hypothetical protein DLM62_19965 [Pseudonocardiales bacterium]|nr:MAG: hypothetical protein DLM62_19965 [Pseudonocardiales bacterium]